MDVSLIRSKATEIRETIEELRQDPGKGIRPTLEELTDLIAEAVDLIADKLDEVQAQARTMAAALAQRVGDLKP